MSNIKQLVNKKVKGDFEVKFKAESDSGILILESSLANGEPSSVGLYLESNGSPVKVKGLFQKGTFEGEKKIEPLKFVKGEQYILSAHLPSSERVFKVGVFWE